MVWFSHRHVLISSIVIVTMAGLHPTVTEPTEDEVSNIDKSTLIPSQSLTKQNTPTCFIGYIIPLKLFPHRLLPERWTLDLLSSGGANFGGLNNHFALHIQKRQFQLLCKVPSYQTPKVNQSLCYFFSCRHFNIEIHDFFVQSLMF